MENNHIHIFTIIKESHFFLQNKMLILKSFKEILPNSDISLELDTVS